MLRLQLTNTPSWLDLGHRVRVLVEPMSTAMMIAARRDPQIAALGDALEALNNDDLALVMAKAVARIAIKDWEGAETSWSQVLQPLGKKSRVSRRTEDASDVLDALASDLGDFEL